MCGIAGVFGGAADAGAAALVGRMSRALCHRGPDDAGECVLRSRDGTLAGAFAHRRLSILDLSAQGRQPMAAGEGRFVVVFNGEIYNFRELRHDLEVRGVRFRSNSDTEVLLEGWLRDGDAFVPRLRGMFAFAIWDRETGRGTLARDAFGIKPLYVCETAGAVVFASEMRALAAAGVVTRAVSRTAVAAYLSRGAVPEPLTMLAGVRPLTAGTVMSVVVKGGRVVTTGERQFAAPIAPHDGRPERDADRAARLVRDALADSVAHHLVSDVPVALFLSGGIDSSAVVALASLASPTPLSTFTVTFGERAYSEAPFAAAVARRFRTVHHDVPLSAGDLLSMLPSALAAMDQPSLDGLNTYAVSAAVRRAGLKVVLSGLGGDELFAGYPAFHRARRLRPLWRAGTSVRTAIGLGAAAAGRAGAARGDKLALLLRGDDPARAAYAGSRALFAGAGLRALLGRSGGAAGVAPSAAAPPSGLSLLQRVSWYELTGYMRDTLLRDSDVFSMAHGLELRVPFLDRAVARAAAAVDDSLKLDRTQAKPLLVRAVADLLPEEVWRRPKRGFELPFAEWLRAELRAEVAGALMASDRLARVGLDARAVRSVWEGFLAGRAGMSWSRPWAIYTLVRWAEALDAAVDSRDDAVPGTFVEPATPHPA